MGKNLNGRELGKGISQRKNGDYCARYVDRFGVRRSIYAPSVREVKNKLIEAQKQENLNKTIKKDMTVNEWFKCWLNVYKKPVVKQNTAKRYMTCYELNIKPFFGGRHLSSITKIEATDFFNKLYQTKNYSWDTLNLHKKILTDMYQRALEDDFVIKNPFKGARLPINKGRNEPKALTVEEQKDFFDCANGTFYYNLFVVAVNTGLRPGELFALNEKDINFKNNEIVVSKTLNYDKFDGDEKKKFYMSTPKTRGSNRTVPMNKICKNALLKQMIQRRVVMSRSPYKNKLEFPDLVFTTKYGTPLNIQIYTDAIKRIVKEINLIKDDADMLEPFGGHVFRHTFATRCFEAGIAPKTVQTYLGHATLKMTMDLYTSVLKTKSEQDMELLEETIDVDAPDISGYDISTKITEFRRLG